MYKKIGKYLLVWGLIILIFTGIAVVVFNSYNNFKYNKFYDELRVDVVRYLSETYPEDMFVEDKFVKGWFNSFSEPYSFYARPMKDENLWFKVNYEDGEFTDNYFDIYLRVGAGDILDEVVSKYSKDYRCFASAEIKDEFGFKEYYNKNGKMLGYDDIEYTYLDQTQITIYDYEDSRNAEPFISEILSDIVDTGLCKDAITAVYVYVVNPKNQNEYTAYYYYYYETGFGGPTSKYTASN